MTMNGDDFSVGNTLERNVSERTKVTDGEDRRITSNESPIIKEPRWRAAVRTFSPQWFSISMDIGILSIVMKQNPYSGNWLNIIATCMFTLNLVVFTVFASVMILRLILYPKEASSQTCSSDEQAASWCCPVIAFMTITAQVALTVSNAWWGGFPFTVVAYTMWWFGQLWMLTTIASAIILMAKEDMVHDRTLSPSIFMLAVGSCTTATVGGTIANYSAEMTARMAIPIILAAYLHVGLGVLLAHMLYGLFLHRLMSAGPPPPSNVPSLVMLAGPFGQGAAALTILGKSASTFFGDYNRGTYLTAQSGSVVSSTSVFFAFLILGLDILLITIAIYFILEHTFQKQLSFNLRWWATIFPLGTVNLALASLSVALDSPAFSVLSSGLLILLSIDFLCCTGFTIRDIWRGQLLDSPEHRNGEQKMK